MELVEAEQYLDPGITKVADSNLEEWGGGVGVVKLSYRLQYRLLLLLLLLFRL